MARLIVHGDIIEDPGPPPDVPAPPTGPAATPESLASYNQAASAKNAYTAALGRLSGRRRGTPSPAPVREQFSPAVSEQLSPAVVPVVVPGEPARPASGA